MGFTNEPISRIPSRWNVGNVSGECWRGVKHHIHNIPHERRWTIWRASATMVAASPKPWTDGSWYLGRPGPRAAIGMGSVDRSNGGVQNSALPLVILKWLGVPVRLDVPLLSSYWGTRVTMETYKRGIEHSQLVHEYIMQYCWWNSKNNDELSYSWNVNGHQIK